MNQLLRRSAAPAVACLFTNSIYYSSRRKTQCDDVSVNRGVNADVTLKNVEPSSTTATTTTTTSTPSLPTSIEPQKELSKIPSLDDKQQQQQQQQHEKQPHDDEVVKKKEHENQVQYHNLFPLRQLWKPNVEYPLWDENWDNKNMESTGDVEKDREMKRYTRKHGVTRHIILIRHGQYDETHRVRGCGMCYVHRLLLFVYLVILSQRQAGFSHELLPLLIISFYNFI